MTDIPSEKYAKMIAKAWKDPNFKKKLLSDPANAMKEMGIKVPGDMRIRCVENTDNEVTIVLPRNPNKNGELNDTQLNQLAAGKNLGASSLIFPGDRMC